MTKKEEKIQIYHKPDWHPALMSILGDIRGQYGYVTDVGTIALLGPEPKKKAKISETSNDTTIKGPLLSLSANGIF